MIKMGRTELQDAVPMPLGLASHAFGESLENEIFALERVENVCRPLRRSPGEDYRETNQTGRQSG